MSSKGEGSESEAASASEVAESVAGSEKAKGKSADEDAESEHTAQETGTEASAASAKKSHQSGQPADDKPSAAAADSEAKAEVEEEGAEDEDEDSDEEEAEEEAHEEEASEIASAEESHEEESEEEEEDEEDEDEDEDDDEDEEDEEDEEAIAVESEGGDTVTTVSNEVDLDSDFSHHDLERQPAQIVPEPPWVGTGDQAKQAGMSCLLPFLLIFLVIYGIFKFLQIAAQCFFDTISVFFKMIYVLIRLILAPFALVYFLVAPAYIQKQVAVTYDKHIGRRVRVILYVKNKIVHTILDIPFIIVSCALAFVDTFIYPAKDGCISCSWLYAGQYIFKYIMLPFYGYQLNRTSKARRKHVDASRKDHDMRAMRIRNQKKAQRRKKEQQDRAKKMRAKQSDSEVALNVPAGEMQDANAKIHVMKKNPIDNFSRTMIVERRYAVGIGFFWSLVGFTMIIALMDGQEGERCEICVLNKEVGVLVCRHGIGRDCSFNLHRYELIIGVVLLAMGNIVMVYATFLYKPHTGAQRAAEAEEERKKAEKEARKGPGNKEMDPDAAAVDIVRETFREPTAPRILKKLYYYTPFYCVQKMFGAIGRPLLKRMYRFEKKKRLKARSTKFTARFTTWAEWYILDMKKKHAEEAKKLEEHIAEHGVKALEKDPKKTHAAMPMLKRSTGAGGASFLRPDAQKKVGPRQRIVGCVCFPVVMFLRCLIFLLMKTPCFRCLSRQFDRCPRLKKCLTSCAGRMQGTNTASALAEAAATSERQGPSLMEDILEKFGFQIEGDDDDEEEEKEKFETPEERKARMWAERPDPLGHVETLRDAEGREDAQGVKDDDDLEPSLAELEVGMELDGMRKITADADDVEGSEAGSLDKPEDERPEDSVSESDMESKESAAESYDTMQEQPDDAHKQENSESGSVAVADQAQ